MLEEDMEELTGIRHVLERFYGDLNRIGVASGTKEFLFAAAQVASAAVFIATGQTGTSVDTQGPSPEEVKRKLSVDVGGLMQ